MTEKQKRILHTALRLFARDGFHATSTRRIAQEADVSEGLIFRHFQSKQGLLDAILANGSDQSAKLLLSAQSSDPKAFLRNLLGLLFEMKEPELTYWRLIYALKWQQDLKDIHLNNYMHTALTRAFRKLEYPKPEREADLMMIIIDGLATAILLHDEINKKEILELLTAKYHI